MQQEIIITRDNVEGLRPLFAQAKFDNKSYHVLNLLVDYQAFPRYCELYGCNSFQRDDRYPDFDLYRYITELGFWMICRSVRSADAVCRRITEMVREQREFLDFPTDGIVIRVDSNADFEALGHTAHHPHGSIAYKFEAEGVTTSVERIEVREAKSGRRTPVAFVRPVTIKGKTISKINLYTERTRQQLGVTEGCVVRVVLQNDTVAKIEKVLGHIPTGEPAPEVEPASEEEKPAPAPKGVNWAAVQKVLINAFAAAAALAVVALAFVCGVGVMFFFLPMLGGAFKS